MKGQYRVISEILLFAIGILITSYVVINFNSLQSSVKQMTLRDQLESVADQISAGVVKAEGMSNGSIRLTIPAKLSGSLYRVSLRDASGGKIVITVLDGSEKIERQLFNINYDNTNSINNVINNSDVFSSAEFIEIVRNEKITLARATI